MTLALATMIVGPLANGDWITHSQPIMGTQLKIELESSSASEAQTCIADAVAEMQRIESQMSPWIEASEISRINRDAAILSVPISAELETLLIRAQALSELSDGAFDITFASVGSRYDYRRGIRPDAASIASTLPAINYRGLQLANRRIRFSHPGTRIDLGGIAKGYAVDRAIGKLRDCGIRNAYISAGGDSRILGSRGNRPWIIGVQHPRNADAVLIRLPLTNSAISTSGDYERFFMMDGQRVHHIIDPDTGHSAEKSMSATVVGAEATTTDGLSTTLFVLGPQKGLRLIDQIPGYDAIIIDAQGRVSYSSGLQSAAAKPAIDTD